MRALRALVLVLATEFARIRRVRPPQSRSPKRAGVRVQLVAGLLSLAASHARADTPTPQPAETRPDAWQCAEWIPNSKQPDVIHYIDQCRSAVTEKFHDARTLSIFFTNIGAAEISLGRYDAALGDLNSAVAADPRFMESLTDRAVVEDHFGNLAEAKADREAVAMLHPRNAEEYLSLATALQHLGRQQAAADAYTTAIQKSPSIRNTRYNAFFGRGGAYLANGQFDLAVADFTTAIQIAPEIGAPWSARCWVRAASGRELDLALSDCNHALEMAPQCACRGGWLMSRGFVYLRMGKLREAAQDLDAVLAIEPRSPDAHFLRGAVKNGEGDTTGGAAEFALARSLNSDVADHFAHTGIAP